MTRQAIIRQTWPPLYPSIFSQKGLPQLPCCCPLGRSSSLRPTSLTSHHLEWFGLPISRGNLNPPSLTDTIWQEASSSRGGLEARGDLTEKRGGRKEEKGSVQHDWVLREMLSSQELFGMAHQAASGSSHVLLAVSRWLSVPQGKTFKSSDKSHKLQISGC